MKNFTFLLILMTYFISADAGVRICKTNWPDMGHHCIIAKNNRVSVDLVMESTHANSSTFSNFKIIINSRSIPISSFRVSGPSYNGNYTYTYRYSEAHQAGDDQFEYKIDYVSLPSNVFKEYGTQPNITLKKPICNPNNEASDYLKLSNNKDILTPTIQPNPFNNELTIETFNTENYRTIDIIDVHGKVLLSNTLKEAQLSNSKQKINTSELVPGIYFCRISNDFTSSITKLIKSK